MRLFWAVVGLGVAGCVALVCAAGEAGADPKKEKPKEKPFKFDAWCVFSDLTRGDRPFIPPDPDSDHSKPNATNLGGYGRRGRWAHVVLDLQNTTDPKDKIIYDGVAKIQLDHARDPNSNSTYESKYEQKFQVAPQSEKQYHFSIFCPEEGWSQNINLEIITNQLGTKTRVFELANLDERQEQLIVVVSDQPGAYKYLGPQTRNINLDETTPDTDKKVINRQVASVTPAELPARWHDLVLASLIIIDGPPKDGLSEEQWDAIRTYAMAGGKVLVMAGKDPARLKGPVEDLCGISVRGTTEVPRLDAWTREGNGRDGITPFPPEIGTIKEPQKQPEKQPENDAAKGKEPGKDEKDDKKDEKKEEPIKSVPLIEVTAPGCSVRRYNNTTKVIEECEKNYGAGRVIFLPYSLGDKIFEHWIGRQMIPLGFIQGEKSLFSFEEPPDDADPNAQMIGYNGYRQNWRGGRGWRGEVQEQYSALTSLRNTLDTSFTQDTPVITQSPNMVAWFMAIYLACAIPLNYIVFTLLRKREAAWLTAPLWALGFTIGAYYVGFAGQTGEVTVNEVSVIECGPGQSNGVARTFMGVYTPRRNYYQVEFPPQQLGVSGVFDTEAAPAHLINAVNRASRSVDTLPSMRLRETGNSISIDEILIQSRDTRRFEVQHRAWVNGGVKLDFAGPRADADPTPQLTVTNNTGRVLHSPVFIKGNQYLEFNGGSGKYDLPDGQEYSTRNTYANWQVLNERFFETFASRFNTDGTRAHISDRAKAVGNYLKGHMSQYVTGVFIAWADGASLPVKVGPTGGRTEQPNLEGITLFVVPAVASSRGWRAVHIEKNPPKVWYTTQYNPEDATSGGWQALGRNGRIAFDSRIKGSVYLALEFDPSYGQYVYEIPPKAAKLTFNVRNGSRAHFNGMLYPWVRNHAAEKPSERFARVKFEDGTSDASLAVGGVSSSNRVPGIKFEFTDVVNFTPAQNFPKNLQQKMPSGPMIVLKLQVTPDDGNLQETDNLMLENVKVEIVPR